MRKAVKSEADWNPREFGPFFLKFKDYISEGVMMQPTHLSLEETVELLRLERWQYAELIVSEDGNQVKLEAFVPDHLPHSSTLRTLLRKTALKSIYEPYFYEMEAKIAEEFLEKGKPLPSPLVTERQKIVSIVRCLWCYLLGKSLGNCIWRRRKL